MRRDRPFQQQRFTIVRKTPCEFFRKGHRLLRIIVSFGWAKSQFPSELSDVPALGIAVDHNFLFLLRCRIFDFDELWTLLIVPTHAGSIR